jgi:hypothetical protein
MSRARPAVAVRRVRRFQLGDFDAGGQVRRSRSSGRKAVASVKDPSLKQIAFQKVLDDLLSATEPRAQDDPRRPARRKPKADKVRGSARGGPTQYIQGLIGDGFFKKPKTISEVKAELGNRGHHVAVTSLSGPLQNLCKARVLRRQKLKTSGKRQTFAYSVW